MRSATRPIVFLRGQQQRHICVYQALGEGGQTRDHANSENSDHLGARQVTIDRCGQAPMWCTLFKLGACMRRTRHSVRARQCHREKKLTVGDIVGLRCSIHSGSYLLNAFESQTQWRPNRRKTADASRPNFQNRCDGTEFQHLFFFQSPC